MVKKQPKQAPKVFPKKTIISVLFLILWTAASVIVSQLLVGIVMLLILGADDFTKPMWTAIYSALSYILALVLTIIVPILIIRKKKNSQAKLGAFLDQEELGFREMMTWTDIGLAVVGFVAYILLAAGIVYLFSLFPWFDAEQVQDVGFSAYMSSGERVIAFLTLVVVAPIAEEIIFRGWLYGKMRSKLLDSFSERTSVIVSILLVSILFGAVHMQWNVGVNVFALSIILCGLREITGTIYAGILLHMLKNGVAFYLLYVVGTM